MVRDLLRQRVPERVLRVRTRPYLMDELRFLERGEDRPERAIVEPDDLPEEWLIELLPDHGRRLEHVLPVLPEAIDAGGEERVDGRRDGQRLERRGEPVGPRASGEGAGGR